MGKKNKKVKFADSALSPTTSVDDDVKEHVNSQVSRESDSDDLLYTKTKKDYLAKNAESVSTSDEDGSESDFDEIETDFDFFDPDERFYHSIRHFMTESILPGLGLRDKPLKSQTGKRCRDDPHNEQTDTVSSQESRNMIPLASRLADVITEQGNIGTVLCVSTDKSTEVDSPVGFATILNFHQYFDRGLKDIKLGLLNAARKRLEGRAFRVFKDILDFNVQPHKTFSRNRVRLYKKRGIPLPPCAGGEIPVVGLLLNERLINLPHEVVPQLLENLDKDVEWSQSTPLCPNDERSHYFFTHLIGLSRCFILNQQDGDVKQSSDKKPNVSNMAFHKYEDEIFIKHSSVYFTIPTSLKSRVAPKCDEGIRSKLVEAAEHRLIFLMDASKLSVVAKECQDVVQKHQNETRIPCSAAC